MFALDDMKIRWNQSYKHRLKSVTELVKDDFWPRALKSSITLCFK